MEQTISNQEQRLQMLNRKKIELTGVMEVISFDTQEVVLDTVEGQLRLEGEDLHVKKLVLERGEVEIQGKVRELAYKEPKIKSTKVLGQLWYGIAGFCAGILVRFFYDVIHGLWRKRTRTACFIRDWCFWLAAGVFVFDVIFRMNQGILRSFFLVLFGGGMILYKKTAGDVVERIVLRLWNGLCGMILRPYVWIRGKIGEKGKKKAKKP